METQAYQNIISFFVYIIVASALIYIPVRLILKHFKNQKKIIEALEKTDKPQEPQ